MNVTPSLFTKQAEEEKEPFYSNANIIGASGAYSGAIAGALLGSGLGFLPGKVSKTLQTRYPKIQLPKLPTKDQWLMHGGGAVMGGLSGAAAGYGAGAGVGGLMDYYDLTKIDKERRYQDYKNGVRERMEELERDASVANRYRLSKTAGIINTIRNATGANVRKAQKAVDQLDNPEVFYETPPIEFYNQLNRAEDILGREQRSTAEARNKLAVGGAVSSALGGTIGLGLHEQRKLDDRIINELLQEREESKRQGASSVSNAPAGVDKTAASSWPNFQEEYDRNPGQRQGVENDRRVIRGEHLPYMAGVGAIPGLGGGLFLAGVGGFGKSKAGKLLGVAGTTAAGAGLGYNQGRVIQNFTKDVAENAVKNEGRDNLTDQERFFMDRSKMVLDGLDRTASVTPLFTPLNKTAGPINFIKNLSGSNVKKQQNKLNTIKSVPTIPENREKYTRVVEKDLKNSKADRNRARLGTGAALIGGGAVLGGYNSYQNSKEPVVDEMNQYETDNQRIAFEQLMERLEKTAGPMDYILSLIHI